ncbi:MAG: hypothetical protein AB7S38_13915 [Vulcanimicrobiota bacterium]
MSTRPDRLFKELLTLFLYEFPELFVPDQPARARKPAELPSTV